MNYDFMEENTCRRLSWLCEKFLTFRNPDSAVGSLTQNASNSSARKSAQTVSNLTRDRTMR